MVIFLSLLILTFMSGYHFKEIKKSIHLINTQRFLFLFKVSHKAQSYSRLQRKLLLFRLYCFRSILTFVERLFISIPVTKSKIYNKGYT